MNFEWISKKVSLSNLQKSYSPEQLINLAETALANDSSKNLKSGFEYLDEKNLQAILNEDSNGLLYTRQISNDFFEFIGKNIDLS